MAHHHDLLHQARLLATHEPRKPKQASLRRSISTSYYALFHLLTFEAASRLIPGSSKVLLRDSIRRAFEHSVMKEACKEITKNRGGRLQAVMPGVTVPMQLQLVAHAFISLQEARHEADYNMSRSFTRLEALDIVDLAERAFANWQTIRKSLPADVFLTALLANRGMCR